MNKLTLKLETTETTITIEQKNAVYLPDLLLTMTDFLRAAGFKFDGQLQVVDDIIIKSDNEQETYNEDEII